MNYFNDQNTDGFDAGELETMNHQFERETEGLDSERDACEIQHIGEQILELWA